MRAMITSLAGVPNTAKWHITTGYMEAAVVEGNTTGLGLVQDASFFGSLSSECIDREWMLSRTRLRDSGVEVCIDNGENWTEKLFGKKGIAGLDSGDDRWCEVQTLTIPLATIDDFSGGLLE